MSSRIGASKWRVHDPSGVTYILPRERGRRRQALPLAPIQLQTKGGYVPRRIGRERIGRLSLGRLATVGTDGCKEAVTSSKCNSRFARSKAASNLVFLDILSALGELADLHCNTFVFGLGTNETHPPQRADALSVAAERY